MSFVKLFGFRLDVDDDFFIDFSRFESFLFFRKIEDIIILDLIK